jgi:hypothetical protein
MLATLRDRFGYDPTGISRTSSMMYRYFEVTPWWPTACLFALAPLALVAGFVFARRNRAAMLLALTGCGLVAGEILCSHIVSFRYLHPFTVLVILNAAAIIDAILKRRAERREQNEKELAPAEALAT